MSTARRMDTEPGHPSFRGSVCTNRVAGAFTLGHWVTTGSRAASAHGHAEAHFMYVPPGTAYITEARGEPSRTGANLIFNPAQTYHADRLTQSGQFFSISLSQGLTNALDELQLPANPAQIGRPQAHAVIGRLMRTCARGSGGAAASIEALCLELLSTLLRPLGERRPPRWLSRAVEILQADFAKDISVSDVARRVAIHPVYLARAFRTHLGCTPGEYLQRLRLQRAADLLDRSKSPISEIALAAGFADQSHFTKQFRTAFGLPPGEYRRLTSGAAAEVAF